MINIPVYQVDAFTSDIFTGNPAAVCILDEWLDDKLLQLIAAENNHSETAFLLKQDDGFEIRWFTPVIEVALCGHATLASSFVVFQYLNWQRDSVRFYTRQSGVLEVRQNGDLFEMDFPARPPTRQNVPGGIPGVLGRIPLEAYNSVEDLLVVVENERIVRELQPDLALLMQIEQRGLIVTAEGDQCDFVSRFFAPQAGIPEDPVTGSAHCVMVPYWSKRLKKPHLHARQVSKRGGELFCRDLGERVIIAGKAVLYLQGTIRL